MMDISKEAIKNKRTISSIFMAAITFFAAALFDPYVTAYLLQHGFNKQAISLITSIAPLSLIVFPPIIGRVSDVIGRRRIINIGIILFLVSQVMYLNVGNSYSLLLLATLSVYIGFEAIVEILLARAEDGAKKHRGVMTGIFESFKQVGYILGIGIGAIVVSRGPIENNIKLAIYVLIFLLVFNNLRPTHAHNKASMRDLNPIKDIGRFFKIKELRPMAILGATINFSAASRTILIPIVVIEILKIDIKYIGLFIGSLGVGHLFQFVFGYLSEKLSHIKIINLSITITAMSLVLVSQINNINTLLALGVIMGFALAFWNTTAWSHMSEIGEKHKEEGTIVGSYTAFSSFGNFLGYITCGILLGIVTPSIIFIIFALVMILGLLTANIYFKKYISS